MGLSSSGDVLCWWLWCVLFGLLKGIVVTLQASVVVPVWVNPAQAGLGPMLLQKGDGATAVDLLGCHCELNESSETQ